MTPGYCHAFHFTRVDRPRLLEASRFSAAYLELSREKDRDDADDPAAEEGDHVDSSSNSHSNSNSNVRASTKVKQLESLHWFGEVNICNLGT